MYSPSLVTGIPYMTRKSKNKNAKSKTKKQPQRKNTPFADTGEIVGNRLASMFNMPMLKGVGRWLGEGVGHIFGSGDYQIVGGENKYNILTNSGQIPKFSRTDKTNLICHREYLGNIDSTTYFFNREFNLNPGDSQTFPWLSTIAAGFQEYKFHGMIFEFKSLTTDYAQSGKPGVLIMATNYNAVEPAFTSKIEMESTEFAVSTKPTVNLLHPVECAAQYTPFPKAYVRHGPAPAGSDPRLYDLGKMQIATTGADTSTTQIGELWVSYCVEFFKPRLNADLGSVVATFFRAATSVSAANPLGLVQTYTTGDLDVGVGSAGFTIRKPLPGKEYLISYYVYGDTAGAVVHPVLSYTYCGVLGSEIWVPEDTTSSRRLNLQMTIKVAENIPLGSGAVVSFGTAGTLPTVNTGCYLTVTEISTESQ